MSGFPPYVPREVVSARLPLIFPEGTPNRIYCIRDLAASTVFAALYIGAVEGAARFFAPAHVYRMTDEQAAKSDEASRKSYALDVLNRKTVVAGTRWYADNTREPIRDETLRGGLVSVGAITARSDLPTTSSAPRYALKADFANLFDPELEGATLSDAIESFQTSHLTKAALARVAIMRAGAGSQASAVLVAFPNGETRLLAPGPSSIIAKAVVETFARRFLEQPAVLWLSESGNKVVLRDEGIAQSIGLKIEADKNLPDLILADLGPQEPLLLFVEVVATDGAVTQARQEAIYALTDGAGFPRRSVAFLTAYQDREAAAYKRTGAQVAWNSFVWFVSEPDHVQIMRDGTKSPWSLASLIV